MTVTEYIKATFNAAWELEKAYGLPRLAVIAQSALENGYGKHTPGNMYFGIKAGSSWKGKKQLLSTTEYINGQYVSIKDWFRAYDSAKDSFLDYGKFITSNSRYKEALKYKNNPEKYIYEIRNAGYATDPNYVSKVKNIMNQISANETYKLLDKNKGKMTAIDYSIIAAFVILGALIGYKLFKN